VLNRGERTIRGTYDEIRAAEKAKSAEQPEPEITLREQPPEKTDGLFTVKTTTIPDPAAPMVEPKSACAEPVVQNAEPKTTPAKPTTPAKISRMPKLSDKEKEERAMAMMSPKEREAVERHNAFLAMTPEQKFVALQAQLKAERSRAPLPRAKWNASRLNCTTPNITAMGLSEI
jgi:hypothetical protein